MRFERSIFAAFMFLSLCLVAFNPPASASAPAELIYGQSSVEWPSTVPGAGLVLTVSGPEGLYLRQEYQAGSWPRLSLIDEQGRTRPDGLYKWELILQAESGSEIRSGVFLIQKGRFVGQDLREESPAKVEGDAPENSLYIDNEGRVGIGTSVPNAQLHLKGRSPALAIEDTRAGGRAYFFKTEADSALGLFDQTAGKVRWLVDAEGRLGINTTQPTSTLTVDGYIETTKGFLVNGRPLPAVGGFLGTKPLLTETDGNNYFGVGAGASNTTGHHNAFFGAAAGYSNTGGLDNSFFGHSAGNRNTTGNENSFFGRSSGELNTTGTYNSFFGSLAGYSNSVGWDNSFFGCTAGQANTEGTSNSFFGANAGKATTTGDGNSFFGESAGRYNTGGYNTAVGHYSAYHLTTEVYNTFLGAYSDIEPNIQITNATAIGYKSYVSRSNSVVLGAVKGYGGALAETFVGIGTPSPDRQLVVEGSQAIGKFRRLNATGPDFAPAFLLERGRGTNTAPTDITPGDYLGKVQFRGWVGGTPREYGALAFISSDTNQNGRFSFVDRDLVTERMVVLNSGNVGIGTNAPTERLDVNGNLRVRGSVVYGAPAVPVPDYVFERDFRLMPLSELEQYVAREKHLPDIPNASEIQANGVNLGEFQMKLLQKVEELTLHTIEQAKVIESQGKEIEALKQLVKQVLAERR